MRQGAFDEADHQTVRQVPSRPQLKRDPLDGGAFLVRASGVPVRSLFTAGLSVLSLGAVDAADGQRLVQPLPQAVVAFSERVPAPVTAADALFPPALAAPPRTYWLEGGLIGGVGVGLFGAFVGHGLCTDSDVQQNCTGPTLGLAALGGCVGFTVGALIGGQFRKGAPVGSRSP